MKKPNWKQLLLNLAIPLVVGGLSALLIGDSTAVYTALEKPPLAPPPLVFPIVWTALYALMGVSTYLISQSSTDSCERRRAYLVYAGQLALNFFWPLLFFRLQAFLLSFVWLLLLIVLVVIMILRFRQISRAAARLQLPYLLWCAFAAYLNLGIYLLNR